MRSSSIRLRRRRSQGGVALVEALVSILIFSFGVLGLVGLEASAINYSEDAEDRNRAAVLANEIASSMWLANSTTLSGAQANAYQTIAGDQTQGGLPNGKLTIAVAAAPARSADISITWQAHTAKAGDQNRQFTTRVILP